MTTLSETMTDRPAGAKRRSDPGRWMTWPAVIYLLLMTQALSGGWRPKEYKALLKR